MQITEAWLLEHEVCEDGITWWHEHGQISDVGEAMHALAASGEWYYANRLAMEARWSGVVRTSTHAAHFLDGWLDREDGPAFIEFYEEGMPCREIFYSYGQIDRPDGPAYLEYCKDGAPTYVEWWLNGKLHNPNGPALRSYDDHRIQREEYRLNGKKVSREDVMGGGAS